MFKRKKWPLKDEMKKKIIVATHNAGKLQELKKLLDRFEITSSGEMGLPDVNETGKTFAENAILKAKAAASNAKECIAIGEDSGLCVNALDGAPGICSKRWADDLGGMEAAMQKLESLLQDKKDRTAFFICVVAAVFPDGTEQVFEGKINGQITWPMRGNKGFGYDPIFIPDGETRTFAEMTDEEKNRFSHRGIALRKLIATLNG